jgi:hypothetical protein
MPIVRYTSSPVEREVRSRAILFSDMNAAADWTNFATGGVNTFTTAATNTDGNRVGVLDSNTSTSATGSAGIGSNAVDSVVFGTREHRISCTLKIPTLSVAAQTFSVTIGFSDNRTSTTPTDGVYFQYTHGASSGNWTAMSYSSGGTLTSATDTGVAADTNWHTFDIVVNKDASTARFYIDGVLKATRSTASSDSIPTGSARATAVSVYILKSVGTTARSIYVDQLLLEIDADR